MAKHTPGAWGTSKQPGGGWIAVRYHPSRPGGVERLPASGEFNAERDAIAAMTKRDYLAELGYELYEHRDGWIVREDGGDERPASLCEVVLWKALQCADAATGKAA